ncbi:hypothetical protein NE237_022834 [Protea cynaroides]|uniref:Uncharacterized protein n=1 Tax=Protea cynaroides TaxID=273540 RepID=A0A9Q0HBQ0_9MAGN|nr:hypothetical protein NE237_022834 [Protea cynaroides]
MKDAGIRATNDRLNVPLEVLINLGASVGVTTAVSIVNTVPVLSMVDRNVGDEPVGRSGSWVNIAEEGDVVEEEEGEVYGDADTEEPMASQTITPEQNVGITSRSNGSLITTQLSPQFRLVEGDREHQQFSSPRERGGQSNMGGNVEISLSSGRDAVSVHSDRRVEINLPEFLLLIIFRRSRRRLTVVKRGRGRPHKEELANPVPK